jgi:hypothetical protein
MPSKKSSAMKKTRSRVAPKKKPGQYKKPKGKTQAKSKTKKRSDGGRTKTPKPKPIYYEDYVSSESEDSDVSSKDSGDSARLSRNRKKSKSDFDKTGVESPRTYDLFFGKPEVNANAEKMKATFTPQEEHVRQMYADDPDLQSKVYSCAVENDFGSVQTISRFRNGTALTGTPGVVAATIDFLIARREALNSGSAVEDRFSDETFDLLEDGVGVLMKRIAPWKNAEKTLKSLKLSSLGYDGSVEKFPHFIACIFAALDGPVLDGASFDNLKNQLKVSCSSILEDGTKEFCYHFGRKLVEQLWKHRFLVGKAFGEKVPQAVHLAFSLVNPIFLEKGKSKATSAEVDAKKSPRDRFKELESMPGWIPPKVYKSMTKEQLGKFACPWFIRNNTCKNTECSYGHSKSLPLYIHKD